MRISPRSLRTSGGWLTFVLPSSRRWFRAFAVVLPAASALAGALLPAPAQQPFNPVSVQSYVGTNHYTRTWGLGVADFDGDGTNDFVLGSTGGDIDLYTGNGDGTLTSQGQKISTVFHTTYGLAAGDFNGDGTNDVVFTSAAATAPSLGGVYLYLGNGDGTFQLPRPGGYHLGQLVGDAGDACSVVAAATWTATATWTSWPGRSDGGGGHRRRVSLAQHRKRGAR